jgi:DNA-binding CsgD family transcriptional regulator
MWKSLLEHGRASFDRRAWGDAFEALAGAETAAPLDPDDLERLVWSAALTGHDEAFLGALERLHAACVEAQDFKRAARAAFWLGWHLMSFGSAVAASAGWLARASRLVEHENQPCAELGYLLLPTVYRHLDAFENVPAQQVAREAAEIGERCGDGDLVAFAQTLEGRALLREGRIAPGLALLDELMIVVTSEQLSPLVTGIVCCNVIVSCRQIYALDRAREWTAALTRWCEGQQQLVTFTGLCLVHRAEILQLSGAWAEAIAQVKRICDRVTTGDPEVFGDACYQQAELLRLRGDFAEAETAYRLASQNGCEPQPGLSLLRLTQGQTEAAVSSIRRVLSTTTVKWQRARLLPAYVEVMLSAGEFDDAREACAELENIAREFGTEILGAMAGHARGAVSVAAGDHHGAIGPLRHAFEVWHRIGAPYIAARIRLLLGRAFLALGDREGADLEYAAARRVFSDLGAAPDLAALEAADQRPPAATGSVHGLSKREIEVLLLLASGKTNKVIARELFVSERTIDRHVSNIFTKIGVATRAAATAFAYENRLV